MEVVWLKKGIYFSKKKIRNILKSFKKLFSFQKVAKIVQNYAGNVSHTASSKSINADIKRVCSKNVHKRLVAVGKANGGYIEKK